MNTRTLIGVAAVWLWLRGTAEIAAADNREFFNRVRVTVPDGAGAVLNNLPGIVARQVERRCGAKVVSSGSAPFTLELAIEPGIGKEGFKIIDGPQGAVRIAGNDKPND